VAVITIKPRLDCIAANVLHDCVKRTRGNVLWLLEDIGVIVALGLAQTTSCLSVHVLSPIINRLHRVYSLPGQPRRTSVAPTYKCQLKTELFSNRILPIMQYLGLNSFFTVLSFRDSCCFFV